MFQGQKDIQFGRYNHKTVKNGRPSKSERIKIQKNEQIEILYSFGIEYDPKVLFRTLNTSLTLNK